MEDVTSDRPMHQRQERRDAKENRERILDAARQLFAAQGVAATSMNEIAQVAQVGPGTLYRRFAHKGALCEALLADDLAAFWQRVDTTLLPDPPGSALSQLGWFLDELLHMTESHLPLFAAILDTVTLHRHEVHQSPIHRELHERISHLLTRAVTQGEIMDLDVELTADVIIAAVAPPLYDFQRQYRHFSPERIAAGIRSLFVDGLRAHPVGHEDRSR